MWICQHPMQARSDKLRQRLIDRQMIINEAVDWWRFRLGMSYGQRWTFGTYDTRTHAEFHKAL